MSLKQKNVKDNSDAHECDEKSCLKENMMLVNQPSESANTKEVRKKGDWKRTMLVNAMIRIFFFERQNMMLVKQSCESTSNRWRKTESKKKKVEWLHCLWIWWQKKMFERRNMTLLIMLATADGPTPQLTDKVDRAIRENTNQVLQRCAAFVRRIKLRLQGQTATNFGARLLWLPRQ